AFATTRSTETSARATSATASSSFLPPRGTSTGETARRGTSSVESPRGLATSTPEGTCPETGILGECPHLDSSQGPFATRRGRDRDSGEPLFDRESHTALDDPGSESVARQPGG